MARKLHPKMRQQANKMKACSLEWKRKGRPGKWGGKGGFASRCMKKR